MEVAYNLFFKVVSLSVMASVLALLILAARFLFKDRLKPAWTYFLWIPLIVRLVIPWTPESAFSIFNLLPLEKESAQTSFIPPAQSSDGYMPAHGMNSGESGEETRLRVPGTGISIQTTLVGDAQRNPTLPRVDVQTEASNVSVQTSAVWTPENLLVLVWLVGVVVVLGVLVREQLRFTRQIRWEPEVRSPEIQRLFEVCQLEMHVRRPVKLIETQQIAVPALIGVLHPKLLLPSSTLSILEASELRYVFLHELAHAKRRDIPLNLLTSLLLALHWFNPLLWYAVRQMKVDQEVACDALALTRLEQEDHRSYALTLLKLLESLPGPIRLAGAAGISSGKKEMEHRIIMITRHKRITVKNALLGIAVIMALSSCTLTGAKPNSASLPEKTAPVASQTDSPVKETASSSDKGILLVEKNGITVVANPTAENTLLHEVTINVRGEVNHTYLWDAVVDESRPPLIDEADVNGDGTKEIIIRIGTGTGTGLSMTDIHVLEPVTLEELIVEDPAEALNERLKSSITHRDNHTYVSTDLDGKHLSRVYDYTEGAWGDKIGFGAIVSYELSGDQIVARLAGAASMTEFPIEVVVVYGKNLTLDSANMYYNAFISPPLSELDVKTMMEQRLPTTGWSFGKDGDQYIVDFEDPPSGEGQGNTYKINSLTGTVYDSTSGNPLSSLVNRDAIDLWEVSNGSLYQKELYKLLQPILDTEDFEPARKEWISGFIGDGYLFGEVRKEGREFTIKADVFTGQWEEIPDPFNS